ncbi:hypothetical protein SAMN02745823_03485 [Sporobacter termitidis DSM 10068]|uniref:Uncharacterized protein n=1 Tax=Sporobacter termitidis DSM 10068 TaxID=1123282 RepID=A0A1M5ZBC6_9FIRM|nr:hypothetical protein [Sporobacter termitidis]SHI21530.1 hypothetical protein SAMN02745823_03485 [Sporobacter termitidis DSM 10068]
MKKSIKKCLALIMSVCVGISLLTVSAQAIGTTSTPEQLKQLENISSEYGISIKEIKNSDKQEYAAKYDNIQDFEAALQAGKVGVSIVTPGQKPTKAIEHSDEKEIGNTSQITPLFSGTMTVHLVSGGLYEINASMGYTYDMIGDFKYYTGFTAFTPYFEGIHPGITFDLISWYGTPISDFWFEDDGQFIYVPASSARMYFYQWEGNVNTTVSIGGISYVISQYAWSWGQGGG